MASFPISAHFGRILEEAGLTVVFGQDPINQRQPAQSWFLERSGMVVGPPKSFSKDLPSWRCRNRLILPIGGRKAKKLFNKLFWACYTRNLVD